MVPRSDLKIDRSGPKINSVIEVNPDALKDANALDAEVQIGKDSEAHCMGYRYW